MICFDFITNQTDRHDENYGILINKTTGEVTFAPLFDNDYISHDENYPDKNDIAFNMRQKIDRDTLIKIVGEQHLPEVIEFYQELALKYRKY